MRVAICVPYRGGDCEYRDRAWIHVRQFLETQHPDWPIYVGTDDTYPFFKIGKARNNAASEAGDWDVAVFADADTMVHPDALREAVDMAATSNKLVFAANGHIYADELSTHRFMATNMWFPTPTDWPDTKRQRFAFDAGSVYRDPSGGVFAINRELWRRTGGYVDSLENVDSHEDLVFFACAQIYGDDGGIGRVAGMQLHCYHPPAPRIRGVNHRHYHHLVHLMSRPNVKQKARAYLADLGHVVP